jgi:hypothetical protein
MDTEKSGKDKKKEVQNLSGKGFIKLLKEKSTAFDSTGVPDEPKVVKKDEGTVRIILCKYVACSLFPLLPAPRRWFCKQRHCHLQGWRVLNDDYLMKAKLSNWGVESDSDDAS